MQLSQQPNILIGDDSDQSAKDISCSRPQRTKRQINRLQVGLPPQSLLPVSTKSSPRPVVMLQKHKNGSLMAEKLQLMEMGSRREKREHKNDVKSTPYRYKNQCFKKTKIEYRDEKVESNDNDSKQAKKTYPSMVTYDSDCDDWYRPWPPVTINSPSTELGIEDKSSSEVSPQEPMELTEGIGGTGIDNTLVVQVKKRFKLVSFSRLSENNIDSRDKVEADVYDKESQFKESVKLIGKTKVNKETSRVSGEDKAMGPLGDKVNKSETVSRQESSIPRREKDTDLLEDEVETSPNSSPQESSKFIVIGDHTRTDEMEALGNNNASEYLKEPSRYTRANEKMDTLEDGENNCRTVLSKEASCVKEGSLKTGVNVNGQNVPPKESTVTRLARDDERIDLLEDGENNILPGSQDTTPSQDVARKNKRYISNWVPFLMKRQLYIEGDILNFGDAPIAPTGSSSRYFTSRIVSRTSEREVASKKTVYVLEGPMTIPKQDQDARPMPLIMIDKFKNGFPEDWKAAVDIWKASA